MPLTKVGTIGKFLQAPIKFVALRVLVDEAKEWSCVETVGQSTRKDGKAYNNEYVWLMKWNADGKIEEVRSYFDTALSEEVLREGEAAVKAKL